MMTNAKARRTFYALAAAATAATLVVSGCGGGGDSIESTEPSTEAAAAARPDLCELLTRDDIEAALGSAPDDRNPGEGALGECTWPAVDGSGTIVHVTLDKSVLGSFDEFVTEFGEEFGGENPPPDEYHALDGVPGDWAMYVAEEHTVRAFRGDRVLEIAAPSAEEAQVVDLATRAMGRLP